MLTITTGYITVSDGKGNSVEIRCFDDGEVWGGPYLQVSQVGRVVVRIDAEPSEHARAPAPKQKWRLTNEFVYDVDSWRVASSDVCADCGNVKEHEIHD